MEDNKEVEEVAEVAEVAEVEEVAEVAEVEEVAEVAEVAEKKREIMTIEEVMIMLDFDGVFDELDEKDKELVKDVYNRFNRVIV